MFDVLQSTSTIVNPAITSTVHDLLLNLTQLGVLALVALASYATKLAVSHLKYNWQQAIAAKFVAYAEQRILTNPEKLAYVKAKLKEVMPRLSEEEIEHTIELAVSQLKPTVTKSE